MHRHAKGVPPLPIASNRLGARQVPDLPPRQAPKSQPRHRRLATRYRLQPRRLGRLRLHGSIVCRLDPIQAPCRTVRRDLLLLDHGKTFRSKAPPIEFLQRWLATHAPPAAANKYARLDLGGGLGRCPDVIALFESKGFRVETTAADSSHQNGPAECPHYTIANAVRAMLAGADLPAKFWPYCFQHYLRLYSLTPHVDKPASPYEICYGKKPDLSLLRVFACRVYALPTSNVRPDKPLINSRTGIFLGFSRTMRNVLYYDLETETVTSSQRVAFDEAMNDLEDKPPNARLLGAMKNPSSPDLFDVNFDFPDLDCVRSALPSLASTVS
jgi:hypothetical protein